MFDNIGGKIKLLSRVIGLIGVVSSIIGMIGTWINGGFSRYGAGGFTIFLSGLLVGGIIISALGAVMDVAMSISSALEEVHAAAPSLGRRELFRSGMNIGRDMVGTMTNTLILAFLGSGFTLIIYLFSLGLGRYQLLSSAYASIEVISGIASSIGMILAIPLTAFISSVLLAKRKGE